MSHITRLIIVAGAVLAAGAALLRGDKPPLQIRPNSQPNPYTTTENWGQLPEGRKWGSSSAVEIDRDGRSVWIAERCGANSCANDTTTPTVMKFDPTGKMLKSFGAGMFVFPHGMHIDKENNIWITDGQGRNGRGHQVFKFNSDGKLLLTLGKAGVAGSGNDEFNQPSDVHVGANGDIFVADGHGAKTNARIMKFDKNGKFIKTWGKLGTGPGEFNCPHALAIDSKGRLFVGDRFNNRIQIFDQDGKFLEEWKQFSRPSGLYIDKKDNIYVADSESIDKNGYAGDNPGWKRGIRIGSAKDGTVVAFIPDPTPGLGATSAAEGVAADSKGVIYGAEVLSKSIKRYEKKK